MLEMANASEHHRDPGLVGSGDNIRIALGTARLDYRLDPGLREHLKAIGHGEERIAGGHRALRPVTGFANRD